jgi:hypothetical protein
LEVIRVAGTAITIPGTETQTLRVERRKKKFFIRVGQIW